MPWEAILAGATGGAAILIVAVLVLGKIFADWIAGMATKEFESKLKLAEESYKASLALTGAIDTDLRNKRVPVYAELWAKTGMLPMWPWNTELEYKDLQQLTHDFRDWYFKQGGMYLSRSARDGYFDVQKSINAVLEKDQAGRVSHEDYEAIRARCSALRTELATDLLSRRDAPSLKS